MAKKKYIVVVKGQTPEQERADVVRQIGDFLREVAAAHTSARALPPASSPTPSARLTTLEEVEQHLVRLGGRIAGPDHPVYREGPAIQLVSGLRRSRTRAPVSCSGASGAPARARRRRK
jgi:hypothetical protein